VASIAGQNSTTTTPPPLTSPPTPCCLHMQLLPIGILAQQRDAINILPNQYLSLCTCVDVQVFAA
jgi:hypothetical protein